MAEPVRLTDGRANDQLLYFTSPSLTADDRVLVFLSDRASPLPKAGDPRAAVNLFALDRATGELRQLSQNREGYLRSYVYFEGLPERGLGMASPCLHPASGDVYYIQGRQVCCVSAHGGWPRVLAELPQGVVTGFTHVSGDNARLCVPVIDAAAFQDVGAIDATVQRLGLASHMLLYDTATGALLEDVEVPRGWVTHVQFQPGRNDVVLFNHEWPSECGIRRVWLWDGQGLRQLRDEGSNPDGPDGQPRSRADWVCHEVWSDDGEWVVYHGTYVTAGGSGAGRSFLGRVRPDGSGRAEIAFDPRFRRYGHFTLGPGQARLVSDGYYEPESSAAAAGGDPSQGGERGGAWISALDVDWAGGQIAWQPLCRHASSWSSQDAHPHPVFSHAGDQVLFTSDQGGLRAVWTVAAPRA
jgi:hypothetical protein